ncbi:MAG: DUF4364 family protein [Oscillospiraceae bacterium]|nr:DUF4364 family protein [Oscillospiraceae bacterium]
MLNQEGWGFIHGEADIKILILYILRRLPAPIDAEALAELVLIDNGLDYFEYKHYLSELVETAHVEESNGLYSVTAKGSRNGEVLESSLPYSVRKKADRAAKPVAEAMRRRAMILANHEKGENGVTVYLALSDGVGSILDLRLLAPNEAQAEKMEKNFRLRAEDYYNRIAELLSE